MEPYALLVVARTQSLAERLKGALDAEQYLVRWVPSATQALSLALHPSLLIFDLPRSGGDRSVDRLKRCFRVPLLACASGDQSVPRAVDVVVRRPFRPEQLAEWVQTTLMTRLPHMLQAAGLSLDTQARRLQSNGMLHQLPPLRCHILALLMARPGHVVTREELFRLIWHTDDLDHTRVLDVHIAQLRRLLEPDPRHPTLILTERGVGYRLQIRG